MFGVRILFFMFMMLFLPFMLGMVFTEQNEKWSYGQTYVSGIVFMYAVFEVVTVPFTFLGESLTAVTFICGVLYLMCAVYALIYEKYKNIKVDGLCVNKKLTFYMILSSAVIIFQIIYVVIHMHIDDDDSWYVGTAVTSWCTNTINRVYPYTGELMEHFPADYTLSPYPVFFAMLAKIVGIHPAIIMRTIMPAFLIALSYVVWYLIAKEVLMEGYDRFLFFFAMVNLFGNYAIRSTSTFLLFRIWQGKATLCNIFIPIIILYYIRCRREGSGVKEWMLLFLAVIAATMVSSMGVILTTVCLGSMELVHICALRSWKGTYKVCLCIIPCMVELLVYLFCLR